MAIRKKLGCDLFMHKIGGVPMTPDPKTSAKVSRFEWEPHRYTVVVYMLLSARRRACSAEVSRGRYIATRFESIGSRVVWLSCQQGGPLVGVTK